MRMLKYVLILFLPFTLQAQQQWNLTLMSHWNDPNLPIVDGDQVWNDLTGWNDTIKNKEYLIAGSSDSIYFFDITNPLAMIKCDVREGRSRNAINRDYEIYEHYLYCVSDRTSPLGSLQIFDLQYLPDSVHKLYDNDTFSINSHTIFIEAASKRMYLCGNNHKPAGVWSMAAFDISNPINPLFLGELDKSLGCDYTHETYVRHDTAYCSCGYAGLYVFDLRDMNNQKLIGSITAPYVQSGYNHSSWLDSTGKFLMFTDEVPNGLGIKIYNISDLSNPNFITVFNSHAGATPHNAYWKGRFAYVSSYEDGVYIYDLKNIEQYTTSQTPPIVGYYDTYPKNADGVYNGFHGCWGVWPYLKSGNIIASDISEGLFVLKPAINLSVEEAKSDFTYLQVSPNPFKDELHLRVHSIQPQHCVIRITDVLGNVVYTQQEQVSSGRSDITINTLAFTSGIYFLSCEGTNGIITKKIIR